MASKTYDEYLSVMRIAGVTPISESAWSAINQHPEPEKVKCACGHTVTKNLVMSTSRGAACPDCYDSMSE